MYQPNLNHPSTQGYTSPPYRGSPIPQQGPPYQAFSPPPPTKAFSPMSSGHSQAPAQRFQQPYAPSSASNGQYSRQSRYPGQAYGQPQQQPQRPPQAGPPGAGQQPRYKGTLAPGTVVQVEEHQVRVERYLSEGGYAHVYLTTSEKAIYPPKRDKTEKGFTQHCLKRIAFEDDSVWTDVKKEIQVMKALPPNPYLVQYLGSSHTRTSKGGHEVFILMEFCAGGGIIDLLNKRLRDRLNESEILNIFTDVCEAVAAMHALKTPLLHRDLKIENVLSTPSPDKQRPMGLIFKLCDFGSTTFPAAHPPSSKVEADAQAMDLNRHTTLQYRSPEMVEPMLGLAVGLPSDVWALGVLLYKLCYYTTPFEEHGTLAIVNAKYSFPQYPLYSPRIQHLIASMLMEQPSRRPTVFDILRVSHEMSGTRPAIDYSASMTKQLPPQPKATTQQRPTSSNPNLLDFSAKSPPTNSYAPMNPNIQPQRRGRPARDSLNLTQSPLPTPPTIPSPANTVTAPRSQLQVTGDRSSPKPPTPSGSLDAFGLPSAPRTQGSASSGFSDSFGSNPTQKAFRPTSRFGRGLSSNSGFGDSFNSPTTPKADVSRVPASKLEIPQTTSPTATTQTNNADDAFESRYPSIETLSGTSSASHLISPLTSPPPMTSRPSMLGNMTGGDLKQPQQHLAVQTGGPQPRSTHVTGTAFARSPSPIKARAEYFEQSTPNIGPSGIENGNRNGKKKEVDLMTGEEDETMGAPLIRRASSTFHQPAEVPSRDNGRTPTGKLEPDSSDEDEGPESATAAVPREQLPSPGDYKPLDDVQPSTSPKKYQSLDDTRAATLPPKDELPSSTLRSGSRSPQKQRPQTMYGYPTSTSPKRTEGGLPIPQPRPGHVRKGSINDMVSKFEGLNPPSNSAKPKPVLKAKPAQLKKPTLDTVRAEGLQQPIIPTSAITRGSIPPKPQKPQSLNSRTSVGNPEPKERSEPIGYSRSSSGRSFPVVKPKPQPFTASQPEMNKAAETRGGSPDKQQSVNSLVARWNQGGMNKRPVVKPKPVLP